MPKCGEFATKFQLFPFFLFYFFYFILFFLLFFFLGGEVRKGNERGRLAWVLQPVHVYSTPKLAFFPHPKHGKLIPPPWGEEDGKGTGLLHKIHELRFNSTFSRSRVQRFNYSDTSPPFKMPETRTVSWLNVKIFDLNGHMKVIHLTW